MAPQWAGYSEVSPAPAGEAMSAIVVMAAEEGMKPLEVLRACEENNAQWAHQLLRPMKMLQGQHTRSGEGVNEADRDGWTGLHWAARHGNSKLVSQLLQAGADVSLAAKNGETALSISSLYGNLSVALLLIAAKSPLDTRNVEGYTPLMYACRFNYTSIVEALIEAGANPTAVNYAGEGCLTLSSKNGHHDVMQMLINAGAADHATKEFHRAIQGSKDEATRRFLARETRWFQRKNFLVALYEADIIEWAAKPAASAPANPAATFSPPTPQETVFCNLYREIAMYL